ncbi:MAG: hypothetical protein PHC53_05650, partial [Patescibacteria group bacterium]|nr:hypothetical protein [Patescibacteria group bacterium]
MRKSPDSLSKAILGERHGFQEYDQYPDIGEAVINDLSRRRLAAFYGLKQHQARKFMFLRLGIGSQLPLSIHKAAMLLGMTLDDARTLEDDALIELEKVLSSHDVARIEKKLAPSSPEEIQAEIEQKERTSGRYESDDHDLDDDEEEEETPGLEAEMTDSTTTSNLQADSLEDPLHPVAVAIQSLLPRESKVMRLLLGVGTNVPTSILDAQEVLSMTREEIEELAASAMGKLKAELSPEDNRLIKRKFSPKDCRAIKNRIRRE